ncbi:hypothetical protein [uncultured Shewanella sp.]|uniref:hypothetical protein n=1 Tax=uncultured Shewanella sp. TaxID=173975 RepID=UPI00260D9D84|nr:hypothetical protein [uncultured Shewanella sp.]
MNRLITRLLAIILLLCSSPAAAQDFSGYLAAEANIFVHQPTYDGQSSHSISIASQPELYHEWAGGTSFTFVPFGRLDSADPNRTHGDIRELNMFWIDDSWEFRVGIGKVFWGATEFVHLVDIINQTDIVESIDAEEKLGQPMGHLSLLNDWGVVELFILPYFRERTFPGVEGRLRTEPIVDTELASYESGKQQSNTDFAVRYSHTLGDWDLGIYHFSGTSRDPTLIPGADEHGQVVLIPYYEQINQTAVDLQMVSGEWLWKLEALHRVGQGDHFTAATGGFEYSFIGINDSAVDLGVIVEYVYDSRDSSATTPFQDDVILGLRLAFNDLRDTTLLAGWFQDRHTAAKIIQLEAGRRIGELFKLSLELRVFCGQPENDPLHSLRNDDHLQLELAYYF